MAVLLALAAAVVYGAGDFVGGMATRRASATSVVLRSQVLGGVLLAVVAVLVGGDAPDGADIAWGAAAGVAGGGALALLYHALATGVMSVVAPITGVVAASVPVIAGYAMGERPHPAAAAGMALALGAIMLISRPTEGGDADAEPTSLDAERESGRHALALAIGAGLGFGIFFIGLERTDPDTGLWPLLPARGAAAVALLALVLATRGPLRLPSGVSVWVLGAAICDTAANALYLLAVRRGLLAVVAVLTALYPASTLVLARIVLGERLGRVQRAGLVVAASAVVLISLA